MSELRQRRKINRQRKKINTSRIINQDIIKVSIFFCILAAALIVYLCIFLTFDASKVINNTYNKRTESFKKIVKRGNINSSDGQVLAYSEIDENGNETRYYPFGNLFSHVVGFEDNGALGLESSYNFYMLTTHTNMFEKISNEFNGLKNPGDSINTTLDVDLQRYIYDIFGGYRGGVIALDPSNGHVYSMVSKSDFDPNTIAFNWEQISNDEGSPLVNRVTQGQYAPGSTFKIFSLNEYMNEYPNYEDFNFYCEGTTNVEEGVDISCSNYSAHGQENLKDAFAYSCNCAFSNLGLMLDLNKFKESNEKLLFNKDLPIDIASNKPSFELPKDSSKFIIMQTTFGQGQTLTNPLHLSLVMSAIANNGVLMNPHMVVNTVSDSGNVIEKFNDSKYGRLFSDEEVIRLREYLRAVVEYGTASILNSDIYTAYGKTGTAQTSNSKENEINNSWFVGYAEKDGQKLVVCAIIEDINDSEYNATNIAKNVFDYYFN